MIEDPLVSLGNRRGGSNLAAKVAQFQTATVSEMLLAAPGDLLAGIGDNGSSCETSGFWHLSQDQDPSTNETYHLIIRSHDKVTSSPDMSTAGLMSRIGPLTLPPSTSTTPVGWIMIDTFGSPAPLPCQGGFYYGIGLPAQPNLWLDGHGILTSWYIPSAGNATLGDNPRIGAPDLTWAAVAGSGIAVPGTRTSAGGSTHAIGIFTPNPNLNVGNIDPGTATLNAPGASGYGAAGLYPDISGSPRNDGIDLRVSDPLNPGGLAVGVVGVKLTQFSPIPVPGLRGRFWLDPTVLITTPSTTLDLGGVGTIPVLPAGSLNPSYLGVTLYCQSLTIGASGGLSNVCGVSF